MQKPTSGFVGLHRDIIDQDGKTIFTTSQDCTPIAEWCKIQHNEGNHGSADMKFAMRIGPVMIEKYINETGITYEEFMSEECHIRAILNNPEYADFRIWKGAV